MGIWRGLHMGGVQGGTLCFLGETWRPAWRLPERTETKTSTSAIMSSGQKSLKLNYLDRTEGMFGVNWIQSSRNRSWWQLWSRRWKDRGLEMLWAAGPGLLPPVGGFWRTMWDHLQITGQTGWKLRKGALSLGWQDASQSPHRGPKQTFKSARS